MKRSGLRYRDSVCAVLQRRSDGRLLVCHRKGFPPAEGWQFPQGGVDRAKGIADEMKRELREEIGTDKVEIVSISPKSYTYRFPPDAQERRPGYIGQRQRWVLARFCGGDDEIRFEHVPAEFDAFEWVDAAEALKRIVDFKRDVYSKALGDFGLL